MGGVGRSLPSPVQSFLNLFPLGTVEHAQTQKGVCNPLLRSLQAVGGNSDSGEGCVVLGAVLQVKSLIGRLVPGIGIRST